MFSGITSAVTATPASLAGLYVGTSGWSYPSWKPGFYAAGTKSEDFLRYYAERFPTVELNTTGYRLPREELFERWAEQTPPGFRFAPKLNAHRRSDYGTFAERVGLLGERLGPIRVRRGRRPRRRACWRSCSAPSIRRSRWPWISATSRGTASKPSSRRMPYV